MPIKTQQIQIILNINLIIPQLNSKTNKLIRVMNRNKSNMRLGKMIKKKPKIMKRNQLKILTTQYNNNVDIISPE